MFTPKCIGLDLYTDGTFATDNTYKTLEEANAACDLLNHNDDAVAFSLAVTKIMEARADKRISPWDALKTIQTLIDGLEKAGVTDYTNGHEAFADKVVEAVVAQRAAKAAA